MVLPGQTGPWAHAPGSPRPDHLHFPDTRHIGLKTKKIQHLTKKSIQILICQRREERINVILLLSFVLEKRAQEKLAGAQAVADHTSLVALHTTSTGQGSELKVPWKAALCYGFLKQGLN